MKIALSIFFSLAVTGCVTPVQLSEAQKLQLKPVACAGDDACKIAWQKAQLWLVKNSAYKLQTANDTLLQTFNGPAHTTEITYTVTKEPVTVGNYEIVMRAGCDNYLGCTPRAPVEMILEFNNYLRK
jgi:hypothetical protein